MHTKNISFTDLLTLDKFIEENNYVTAKSLLVQVFSADAANMHLGDIVKALKLKLPNSTIIGASTDGEIYGGKSRTKTTVISFSQFSSTTCEAQIYKLSDSQFKIGQQIARELCSADTKVLIVLADGLHTNGDDLLDGIYDVNQTVVVAGGLAGDYRCMQRTLVVHQDNIQENSVVACALNSTELNVNTQNVFGWHPIGKRMLVTKASGNRLYELDGQPLRDVYAKYLGLSVADELPVSAGEYPLIIKRYSKDIARAALTLFPDGSMLYAGNFKVGDKVQFGYGHIPLILSSAKTSIKKIRKLPVESIFIYSCSARKYFMGNEVDKELLPLELLADTSGFFTYGEFFHGGKKNELLNESMTLLMLSEGSQSVSQYVATDIDDEHKSEKHIYDKLFHLIEATGNELTETNEKLELLVAEKTRQIIEKIYFDPLTKLPNRNRLLEDLKAQSSFFPVMIAIINIDDFKQINDYYGYKIGDQVLQHIANKLSTVLSADPNNNNIKLYKFPVDEFAIAANPEVLTQDFINLLESRVRDIFANELNVVRNKFFLNYTLGVSLGRAEANDYLEQDDGVLLQANMATREAKDSKLRMVKFHADMDLKNRLEHNITWTNNIKTAIDEDRFIPYFQPIFSSVTGKIEKYECLIRMIATDGSIVLPYMFLDIAVKAKLYSELTKIMIDKCFAVFSKNKCNFSINLSIADTEDTKLMSYMIDRLQYFNVGNQLTLEILESEGVNDYAAFDVFIKNIKQYGCKIAIDDFGTGYSNFEHLIKMDFDYLKLDGSLIKNINLNPEVKLIVEMILSLCKKIQIKTVAEFVSDEAIFDTVKVLGIDYLQGFYLGKPEASCI